MFDNPTHARRPQALDNPPPLVYNVRTNTVSSMFSNVKAYGSRVQIPRGAAAVMVPALFHLQTGHGMQCHCKVFLWEGETKR
jgi:hypothetical protein